MNGCLAYIDDEDIGIEGLIEHIPADFPTARHRLSRYWSLPYRSRQSVHRDGAEVEVDAKTGRETIIVHEIPYQVNKARLIEKIAELVKQKRVEGISALA
ncbi:DNA gyrase subunit A [Shigella flexneri]